jgi:hypothetical protein
MAKRSRGSSRPGQRRPTQRPRPTTTRPVSARPEAAAGETTRPGGLTTAEEERAAELEAGLVEQERQADAVRRRSRDRERIASNEAELALRGRPRGSLAVRFADEYAYVARDLRRIAILAAVLLAILLSLFALIDVAGVVKI